MFPYYVFSNLFYNIYYERINGIDDLKYVHKGISHVNIELKPETDFTIPLDIIFKLLHANKDVPLIKYNPSSRQEKIYRLYANKISENKSTEFLPARLNSSKKTKVENCPPK